MQIFPVLILGLLLAGPPAKAQTAKRKSSISANKDTGPTLKETQAFVKEKMEQWGTFMAPEKIFTIKAGQRHIARSHKAEVDFDDKFLIIKVEVIDKMTDFYEKAGIYIFPWTKECWKIRIFLKSLDVNGIQIVNNYINIPIDSKSTMKRTEVWNKKDNEGWQRLELPEESGTAENFALCDTAQPDRLLSALKRLVELKGGKRSAF